MPWLIKTELQYLKQWYNNIDTKIETMIGKKIVSIIWDNDWYDWYDNRKKLIPPLIQVSI